MIDELIDLSRLDARSMVLRRVPTDLGGAPARARRRFPGGVPPPRAALLAAPAAGPPAPGLRPGQAAPGLHEPDRQRAEVLAGRRRDRARRRGPRRGDPAQLPRHRHRHPGRGARADLREVLPGRLLRDAALRRRRPRPEHRQGDRAAPRRPDLGREHPRARQHLLRRAAEAPAARAAAGDRPLRPPARRCPPEPAPPGPRGAAPRGPRRPPAPGRRAASSARDAARTPRQPAERREQTRLARRPEPRDPGQRPGEQALRAQRRGGRPPRNGGPRRARAAAAAAPGRRRAAAAARRRRPRRPRPSPAARSAWRWPAAAAAATARRQRRLRRGELPAPAVEQHDVRARPGPRAHPRGEPPHGLGEHREVVGPAAAADPEAPVALAPQRAALPPDERRPRRRSPRGSRRRGRPASAAPPRRRRRVRAPRAARRRRRRPAFSSWSRRIALRPAIASSALFPPARGTVKRTRAPRARPSHSQQRLAPGRLHGHHDLRGHLPRPPRSSPAGSRRAPRRRSSPSSGSRSEKASVPISRPARTCSSATPTRSPSRTRPTTSKSSPPGSCTRWRSSVASIAATWSRSAPPPRSAARAAAAAISRRSSAASSAPAPLQEQRRRRAPARA